MPKLKEIMEEKGVTVRQLAEMAGVSIQTIMRARGPEIDTCTVAVLESIASALGVSVKDLFEE